MAGYQTSFLPQLLPDVPLEPFVVLRDDPRWGDCLEEFARARFFGLDCEGWMPPAKVKFDPIWAILRLVQVGLPSGRVLVADFGGVFDNRDLCQKRNADFLSILGKQAVNPTSLVIGHALKTEAAFLRRAFGFKLRGCRDTMLMSQVYWAGVASKRARMTEHGLVAQAPLRHSLLAVCARLGIHVDKTEQLSDWAGSLTNAQKNYAARDTLYPIQVWRVLGSRFGQEGTLNSILAECDALPAFSECEWNGMPVDEGLAREDLGIWRAKREEVLRPFIEKFPHVNPGSPQQVAVALSEALGARLYTEGPLGKGGKRRIVPNTGDDVLAHWDQVPYVRALLEWRSMGKQIDKYEKEVLPNLVRRDGWAYVSGRFNQIAGGISSSGTDEPGRGMGRSSCREPTNLQNYGNLQPYHKSLGCPPVRRMFRPPPSRALIVADLSQAHARIATQASQDPVLLAAYKEGQDVHCITAASLARLQGRSWTPDDVAKIRKDKNNPEQINAESLRKLAKPVFYGSLNLQGPQTLQNTGATSPEPVHMTLEEAAQGRDAWRQAYAGLYLFQRATIRRANRSRHRFDDLGVDGDYGEVRALTGRRLYLAKEWSHPSWKETGEYSVKGTDCVSAVWMMTEADAMKRAMGWLVADFDAHPEWQVEWASMAHDEIDLTCAKEHALSVAAQVQARMQEAMRWAGVTDIPVDEKDARPEKLIVGDWSEK